MATDTCAIQNAIKDASRDIQQNNDCNTRSILDFLVKNRIEELTAENQTLKFQASQDRQNAYLTAKLTPPAAVPAFVVPNPLTGACGYPVQQAGCSCQCQGYFNN